MPTTEGLEVRDGQIKVQGEEIWSAMKYKEFVGAIQIDDAEHDVIKHFSGKAVDVKLDDGTERQGVPDDYGRIIFWTKSASSER
jgi:hypothetical protein